MVISAIALVACAAAVGGVIGKVLGKRVEKGRRPAPGPSAPPARLQAEEILAEVARERERLLREAEISAREQVLALRVQEEEVRRRSEADLGQRDVGLARRQAEQEVAVRELEEQRTRLQERQTPLVERENAARALREVTKRTQGAIRGALEAGAGETAAAVSQLLADGDREAARGLAAQQLRQVEQSINDAEHMRHAKRVMGISVGRFSGHYLTERHHSLIPIGAPRQDQPVIPEADLLAVEGVAGVKLTLVETRDAVRLEGLDGVGREIARRCLARMLKRPGAGPEAVTRLAKEMAAELDREVMELGRRAFSVLEIDRAHPEIVKLVGRLNYRTSFTQNQWKHAIEAAFLCGMMAEEMRLDRRVARRAALMHDIGKALTHELDGSHAVIGADYARRLGETEVVANAIGAHHTDEPFNSPYAYLVAAADAMSGARPGARRQTEDNYVAKLADLERITRGFSGVGEAFAVQGGREVRVYVKEDRIDDLGAVNLSAAIAEKISQEMTFPGQIRVTVIREFTAVEVAN